MFESEVKTIGIDEFLGALLTEDEGMYSGMDGAKAIRDIKRKTVNFARQSKVIPKKPGKQFALYHRLALTGNNAFEFFTGSSNIVVSNVVLPNQISNMQAFRVDGISFMIDPMVVFGSDSDVKEYATVCTGAYEFRVGNIIYNQGTLPLIFSQQVSSATGSDVRGIVLSGGANVRGYLATPDLVTIYPKDNLTFRVVYPTTITTSLYGTIILHGVRYGGEGRA